MDAFLEQLHGSLKSVSRVLAADVVSVLQRTKGIDTLMSARPAYTSSYLSPFSYTFGLANFHMTGLEPRFDMALRLLKADVATSIHLSLGLDFDTHNGTGHSFSCAHGRNYFDLVARFLGELKSTPLPGRPGKTLLDDTLVVTMSEFGRSWASGPRQRRPRRFRQPCGGFVQPVTRQHPLRRDAHVPPKEPLQRAHVDARERRGLLDPNEGAVFFEALHHVAHEPRFV